MNHFMNKTFINFFILTLIVKRKFIWVVASTCFLNTKLKPPTLLNIEYLTYNTKIIHLSLLLNKCAILKEVLHYHVHAHSKWQ